MSNATNFKIPISVIRDLKKQKIVISLDSIKEHIHQGFMSKVLVADSNRGKLIIHISNLIREHRLNNVWEKFSGLQELLKKTQ